MMFFFAFMISDWTYTSAEPDPSIAPDLGSGSEYTDLSGL